MGQGDAAVVVASGIRQFCLCPLVVQWVAGVDPYQSAHGVASVESRLRTSQDVYALYVVEVEVVCRLVDTLYVVDIKSDGGSVDTAPDSTYIHGACQAAAIVRHEEVRHEGCRTFQ